MAHHRSKGLKVAQSVADFLKREYGVTRVMLFGSMVLGNIREESDIDLAVWGLPQRQYFKAWAAVNDIRRDFPVDLIDINDASEILLEHIENGWEL